MKYSFAKLIVSVVLVVWFFAMPQAGFTGEWEIGGHMLYPLSHANIWHLLANLLCLWMIPCGLHLTVATFVAVLCSFLPCFISEPTVGFSGVLFSIVGISWGKAHRFRDMIWRNKWFLLIPVFIPHVNALLHVYCLVGGYLIGHFVRDLGDSDWL